MALLLTMDQRRSKAFDFANDTTKQLITLSTAIVALTITFLKDVIGNATTSMKVVLAAAWLLYVVSIGFGLLTMMALTGELEKATNGDEPVNNVAPPSIRGTNVTGTSIVQVIAFTLATLMIVVFGIMAFGRF